MKNFTFLLLMVFYFATFNKGIAQSETPSTIGIDGINDIWAPGETFTNVSNATEAYFTWDADYLYFAVSGAEADYDNMATFMYFDIDAYGANGGSASGYAWGENVLLPFKADYALVWKNQSGSDYIELIHYDNLSSLWLQVGNATATSLFADSVLFANGTDYREVRIHRSLLNLFGAGKAAAGRLKIASFTEQQWAGSYRYFAWPSEGWTDGNKAPGQTMSFYYDYLLMDGVTPNDAGYLKQLVLQGNALDFDGSNDSVVVPYSVDFVSAEYTLEAWFKTTDTWGDIISIADYVTPQSGLSMGVGYNGTKLIFQHAQAANNYNIKPSDTLLFTDDRWHHMAVVKQSSLDFEMYFDGALVASGPMTGFIAPNNLNLTIGEGFNGSIDEVRVWNIARSSSEIVAYMDTLIDPSTAGLVAYYRFDESNPATILPDLTSNAHDGTLTNMDPATDWIESYAVVVPVANSATNITDNSADISWFVPKVGGIDNYYLEVATDTDFTTLVVGYNPYKDMSGNLNETITGLSANSKYYYRVRAYQTSTGDVGAFSLSKNIVTLPVINSNPDTIWTACIGVAMSMVTGITPGSEPVTYQWYVDDGGGGGFIPAVDGSDYSGVTSDTLRITVGAGLNTYSYRCIVSNAQGYTTSGIAALFLDTIKPTVACQTIDVYLNATGTASIVTADIDGGTTDACSILLTMNISDFSCGELGVNLVTLTATDANGNSDSCVATVTVLDTISPVITCISDIIVGNDTDSCNAVVNYMIPSATDNCDVVPAPTTVLVTGDIVFTSYQADASPDVFSFVLLKSILSGTQITFTDNGWFAAGGFRSGETTVTWTAPSDLPSGTEIWINGLTTNLGSVTGTALALAVGGDQIFAYQDPAPTTGLESNFLTGIQMDGPWGADATSSNSSAMPAGFTNGVTCMSIDTEVDNANYDCSVINGTPSEIRAAVYNQANWITNDAPGTVAVPNCGITISPAPSATITQIAGLPSGATFPKGVTLNTFVAEDGAGNTDTCTFSVTVNDSQSPVLTGCPTNILVCNNMNPITFATPTAADNCDGSIPVSQTAGLSSGSTFPVGTTTVTFEAQDSSGNNASCSFDVTIFDTYLILVSETICDGDSIMLKGTWQFNSGTFYDSLFTVDGCDSVIETTLSVDPLPSVDAGMNVMICENVPDILLSGLVSGVSTGIWSTSGTGAYSDENSLNTSYELSPDDVLTGTFTLTLATTNNGVCPAASDDVIVTLLPTYFTPVVEEICEGDTITLEGEWQFTPGIYHDTLVSLGSCDSVIETTLVVHPSYNIVNDVMRCTGDSIFLEGAWQTADGTFIDQFSTLAGCDSTITTDLTITNGIINNLTIGICNGDSLFAEGAWQFSSGVFYDTLIAAMGCDSIVITDLTVHLNYMEFISLSICAGDSAFLAGNWQFADGTFVDSLSTTKGCDSIIETTLIVHPVLIDTVFATLCEGDSIFAAGGWKYTSGTYVDSLLSGFGCDSVIVTELTVDPLPIVDAGTDGGICETETDVFLNGFVAIADGAVWSTSGTGDFIPNDTTLSAIYILSPTDILTGSVALTLTSTGNGVCSSISEIVQITVMPTYFGASQTNLCEGDSLFFHGSWQMNPGFYYDSLSTMFGCDSILETELVIISSPAINLGMNDTLCGNESIVLNAGTFDEYMWSDGSTGQTLILDTLITGGTGSFTYSVIGINGGLCEETDSITITFDVCEGMDYISNSFDVTIYPNPNDGRFFIEARNIAGEELAVECMDITGKVIRTVTLTGSSFRIEMNLESVADGLYFVRMTTGATVKMEKLIIK